MMKHLCLLAGTLMLGACATQPANTPATAAPASPAGTKALAADNPFAAPSTLPYQAPPFDRIRSEHFGPAIDAGMAEQRREIDAIAANPAAPTFDNTILALERSGRLLDRAEKVFNILNGTSTNPELQALDAQLAPKRSAHFDAISLDPALFARVHALHERRASLGLDPESLRLLERYHINMVRAGAQLGAADKTRLKSLNEELSTLTTRFQQNLLKDSNDSAVIVDDVAQLAGCTASEVAAAAAAAEARGMPGKWALPLQNPTGQAALSCIEDRALRERLFEASLRRANRDNDADNKAVLARIVALRAQRAQLLGYPTHAAYVLEDETAHTPAAVNDLLERLVPHSLAGARREADDMQQLARAQQGAGFTLQPWDWPYYAEGVRRARYDFDESQMKPYFEMNRVLEDGVFYMARRLYGLSFKRRTDLPAYHADVRVYEVFEEDGRALGLFYFDPYARQSKRGGAWMTNLVDQSQLFGTKPVVVNVLNVPKPAGDEPALMTYDEVSTAFHEFGHALHGLFSNVRYQYLSGTAVPRDFVEFPSQVHEYWMLHPEVLAHYARHWQTGAPMPKELVDRVQASKLFNLGYTSTEYLAAALLDLHWHELPPAQARQDDVEGFERAALHDAGIDFALIPPRYRSTYFGHIFSGGYSAGYYSYVWSEVLDADTVAWFKENGDLDRASGQRFRERLLSRGSTADALALYRDFRGRDATIDALLQRRGWAGTPGGTQGTARP